MPRNCSINWLHSVLSCSTFINFILIDPAEYFQVLTEQFKSRTENKMKSNISVLNISRRYGYVNNKHGENIQKKKTEKEKETKQNLITI